MKTEVRLPSAGNVVKGFLNTVVFNVLPQFLNFFSQNLATGHLHWIHTFPWKLKILPEASLLLFLKLIRIFGINGTVPLTSVLLRGILFPSFLCLHTGKRTTPLEREVWKQALWTLIQSFPTEKYLIRLVILGEGTEHVRLSPGGFFNLEN